jgi:ubiquitin C-terminal hydrolase
LGPGLELNAANLRRISYNYDLAGVVVHSGQANAGHYYSFIKVSYECSNTTYANS